MMPGMSDSDDEYGRFESFARKLVNTRKPKSQGDLAPAAGEPADDGSEREEADGDNH